ncbi:T9SS type A sorting domain-containing protein, partial [bacterium]|nr:T9SS type A sorting domain-containing protein [bacterium]
NWNPVYDGANTAGRSQVSTQGKFGTFNNTLGDWMLRIGGIAGGVFTDVAVGDLYNDVNAEGPSFNLLPGGEIQLSQVVQNVGTAAVAAYTVDVLVNGPGGSQVYAEELVGLNLAVDGVQTLTTTSTFLCTQAGEYLCRSILNVTSDENADNDTTWLRFFAGGNDRVYRYDDNGDADSYVGFNTGSGWALRFTPVEYPAKLTSIRVNVGLNGTGDFRVYAMDEATGLPAGNPLWSATPPVIAGWNDIAVTGNINFFDGQEFAIAYLFQTGVTMGYDNDPPNAASNAEMGVTTFQVGNNGGQFFEDDGGNLCMQAYIDTSSAIPPLPVIATSQDTMDFGTLNPNDGSSATISLWVYNEGGVDPLSVTGMVINPPAIRSAYTLSQTTFSVAAGDSEEVLVTFDPVTHRAYNGLLAINNNSNNNAAYGVILRGTGDSTVSVNEIDLPLPQEYALLQNFPNPFNPQTQINFSLPASSEVRLTVVNMLGQEVALLAQGRLSAGTFSATFDGANLPSGLYFYRLDAGNFTSTRKMMLMK